MNRIDLIASLAKDSNTLLDVGCDHAYVLIKALLDYGCKRGIAADINSGPLNSALQNIKNKNLESRIKIVQSDGLKNIVDDFDTVIIAGMGGNLIKSIILDSIDKLNNKKLILEPNNDRPLVRECLINNGFKIIDEYAIYDMNKYYEVMVLQKGSCNYSDFEVKFGPILLKKRMPDFLKFYENKAKLLEKIIREVTSLDIKEEKEKELFEINKYILNSK